MSDPTGKTGSPPDKVAPEALVLRGRPRPARRFRRGLFIGIAGAVSAAIAGTAWIALDPPALRIARPDESTMGGPATARPDALEGVPENYADIPKLGPPLPGDLGRPILRHRQSIGGHAAGKELGGDDGSMVRKKQLQEELVAAARASSILVTPAGPGGGPPLSTVRPEGLPAVRGIPSEAARSVAARTASSPNAVLGDANPYALQEPASPWLLSSGTLIPASLITAVNSDLPGVVLAQVTENVMDSATGRTVLIPQGARLVGEYGSDISYGQRRALLVWQRIVLPDASSIRLDKFPAADLAGQAGISGRVDFHGRRLVEGIALSSALGFGTELSLGDDESSLVRAIRESSQQNVARAGDQITSRNLDVRPTIIVPPGSRVHAIVNKDLILRPWRG